MFKIPETACFQQAGWNGHGKLAVFFSHSEWPENLSHLWSSPKKCLNFASMHCNVGGKEDPRCTNQPMIICSVHKISSEQKEDIFLSTAMAMAVSATPVGVCLHKWEQSFFKLLLIVFYPDLCIKNERWYFNSNVMQMLIVEGLPHDTCTCTYLMWDTNVLVTSRKENNYCHHENLNCVCLLFCE